MNIKLLSLLIPLGVALMPGHPLAADCTSHWSKKYSTQITRCKSTVREFKRQNPCPSTGKSYGSCPGYVVDHRIALKRGGQDAPSNMNWMDKESARSKDRWE